MFRLLPWSSAIGGNKVMAEELKMLATSPHCAAPGVNSLALPQLKRKRSDSSDSATGQRAPVATKLRADDTPGNPVAIGQDPSLSLSSATATSQEPTTRSDRASQPSHPSDNASRQNPDPSGFPVAKQDATPRKVNVDRLRETLEAQLSLEVLLKHNELRLIDQEIAKCQVALEQLRRCAEIPYPGSHAMGQSVSNGTGMAVLAPGNGPPPLSPAPWGVTDGPYTRHYARWLLPDPRFDGGELEPATPLGFGAPGTPLMEGRSTRGSSGDGYWASKSRLQRGSGNMKLQSLPNGYPPPKEKAGPMIIRRKSDGVLVKLVCLDCRRDNFSSTQGFINHCRIAHNRNFASHDAAAVASGEPVEVDEAGAIIGGKNDTSSTASAGYVHPLIRSAHVIESSAKTPSASEASGDNATPQKWSVSSQQASSVVETPRPSAHPQPSQRNTPAKPADAFLGSPATPHLSSLMQLKGVGLDLDRLVGEAKTPVDLSAYSSDEGESDVEPAQPSVNASHGEKPTEARISRQPMRTTAPQAGSRRPSSRKGVDKTSHKPLTLETLTPTRAAPYQSPYGPPSSVAPIDDLRLREVDGIDRSANLSPNTVESNQAPSLVSDDDDDYGAASDSDSPGPSSSEAGDHEEDFSHIDVEDDDDTTGSTTTSDPKSDPATHPSPSFSKPLRGGSSKKKDDLLSASIVSLNRGKDEKRVSFASPDTSPKRKKDHKRKPSGGQ
ncbi:hypothetical protein F9C07_4048 [Aspergillus flavus]|uniref:AHC1-like C2H2 zinc-finger domain-containing protein n=2 Tax=Aspergillus flavus TaxID=5059 RepID=A0A7G5K659_ASPFN|nr:uncharacterized protein G4B84_006686 [Aspergillus flavus NRRL3357]QMW43351.1 hypothetical protein G4B11_006721 [Aspergillus flavus]KAF7625794.1 hypothetical protein AFLA_002641 [Aspergillus flavus NRRL3357]QMW31305.1 hypothetical protein G4B84_006686 [Aspergillus flavus NRRL3357]QRD90264.1 hypothetical protein F9C07_4048 [Aspergillus flavus]UDD60195.1 hypothetical protein AFCA_007616 [Aspergillus flavus]